MLWKMTHCFGLPTEPGLPTGRTGWALGAFWQKPPLQWELGFEVRCQIRHHGLDSCRRVPAFSRQSQLRVSREESSRGQGCGSRLARLVHHPGLSRTSRPRQQSSLQLPQAQPFKKVGVLRRLKRKRFRKGGQVVRKRG